MADSNSRVYVNEKEETRTWNVVRSDVDDHCAWLDPFALDEESFTDR